MLWKATHALTFSSCAQKFLILIADFIPFLINLLIFQNLESALLGIVHLKGVLYSLAPLFGYHPSLIQVASAD